jgi:hypothetical protein
MNRLPVILILVLIFSQDCKKSTTNPVWDRTYGIGNARFIRATADSGLISCGDLEGKPYLIKLDRNKNKLSEYKSDKEGLFSSAIFNKSISIAAGSSKGKMLITFLDNKSNFLWDTTFSSGYYIDYTTVCDLGNDEVLAVGSASPDSSNSGATGLYFVRFTTARSIINTQEITGSSFIAANKVITDNSGNIYLALTRKNIGSKSKATVAKYNGQLQSLWETELYNNPDFGASSLGIFKDNAGNIYVSGKTGISVSSGSIDNSFTVCLTNNGIVSWKKYLEFTNSGSSVMLNEKGEVLMLNHNCFIIDILNSDDGSLSGTIRTFDVCDSNNTDAYGQDFDINYDGNIILAGSNGGVFYLAMKPPVSQPALQ